jgi:hypothetical protein
MNPYERMLRKLLDEFDSTASPREIDVYVDGVLVTAVLADGMDALLSEAEELMAVGPEEGGEED